MGRFYWNRKDTVEDCRCISISLLKKYDYFCGYRCGRIFWKNHRGEEVASIGVTVSTMNREKYVGFQYTITDRHSGDKTEYDYKVHLTTTRCNFGGVRYWFICSLSCNGIYCGRRVANLYFPPGAKYYGCRHCYNLSYESRNNSRHGRLGVFGRVLKTERQIDELKSQIKEWTYKGRPTKKYRQLLALQGQLDKYLSMSRMYLK